MAFRKVQHTGKDGAEDKCGEDLMYIPQDFHDTGSGKQMETIPCKLKPEAEEAMCQEFFDELPDLHIS